MNSQELSQLQFTDGKDLSKYLKELARSCGFKICLLDSQKSNRIRFYCSLQQQHKKVQYTKKSGCTFHLVFNRNVNGIYILSPNSNFQHSHKLEPPPIISYQDQLHEDVNNMKKVDISNFQIIRYIEKKYNVSLTVNDINTICQNENTYNNSETEP